MLYRATEVYDPVKERKARLARLAAVVEDARQAALRAASAHGAAAAAPHGAKGKQQGGAGGKAQRGKGRKAGAPDPAQGGAAHDEAVRRLLDPSHVPVANGRVVLGPDARVPAPSMLPVSAAQPQPGSSLTGTYEGGGLGCSNAVAAASWAQHQASAWHWCASW